MSAKILIVDDDASIVFMLRESLSGEGYSITEAFDGTTAIDLARSVQPDLIIMDMNMPDISGLEAVTRLRAGNPALERTPVLFLTGQASPSAQQGPGVPRTSHLEKPIDLEKLTGHVKSVLASRGT